MIVLKGMAINLQRFKVFYAEHVSKDQPRDSKRGLRNPMNLFKHIEEGIGPQHDRTIELFYKLKPRSLLGMIDPIVTYDWFEHMKEMFNRMNFFEDRKVSLVVLMLEEETKT